MARESGNSPKLRRNDAIQYLRGYAALFVVVDHCLLPVVRETPSLHRFGAVAGDIGAIGVRIFFVISGYIMLAIGYNEFGRAGATPRFWLARVKRIVPMYYLATAWLLLAPPALGGRPGCTLSQIVGSLLFVANPYPGQSTPMPVHEGGWTLNYEMYFYLIFGLALLAPRIVGLISALVVLLLPIAFGPVLARRGLPPELLYYTSQLVGLFACGMAIALWQRTPSYRQFRIPSPAAFGAGIASLAVIGLNLVMMGAYPAWRSLTMYAVAGLAVWLCVVARPGRGHGLLEQLGNASFSLYLFHAFGIIAAGSLWVAMGRPGGSPFRIAGSATAAIAVGWLAYRYCERPLGRMLNPGSRRAREE